ncbi:MAG TPA: trypsin-like serine protease [Polyangiaceae bacterium]|jgi:hypothetical protein|nr:trypsin-like serine protease [Polyangiaceae bacterium]
MSPASFASFAALCRTSWPFVVALVWGCSGEAQTRLGSNAPSADIAAPPPGTLDHGVDPAVVAIDAIEPAGASPCAGALVAPDVVLTALHCVLLATVSTNCAVASPSSSAASSGASEGATRSRALRAPASLRVLVGEGGSVAVERARGRAIVAPATGSLCGGDIAFLLLDRDVDDIAPLVVRATGAARGDHVRTVGFRTAGDGAGGLGDKVLRAHVAVADSQATEIEASEVFLGAGGGPALDETTAEIVGVASRDVAPGRDVYTRADAFLPLLASALSGSRGASGVSADLAKVEKGPIDLGAACVEGAGCAAGVCVSIPSSGAQYCSRSCSASDHCPTRFRCQKSVQGAQICVES